LLVRISEVLEGKNCYQAVQIYIATFNKARITTEMFLHPTSKNTIIPYKQMIDIGFFNPLLLSPKLLSLIMMQYVPGLTADKSRVCSMALLATFRYGSV